MGTAKRSMEAITGPFVKSLFTPPPPSLFSPFYPQAGGLSTQKTAAGSMLPAAEGEGGPDAAGPGAGGLYVISFRPYHHRPKPAPSAPRAQPDRMGPVRISPSKIRAASA